jgi:hypothetical protein
MTFRVIFYTISYSVSSSCVTGKTVSKKWKAIISFKDELGEHSLEDKWNVAYLGSDFDRYNVYFVSEVQFNISRSARSL